MSGGSGDLGLHHSGQQFGPEDDVGHTRFAVGPKVKGMSFMGRISQGLEAELEVSSVLKDLGLNLDQAGVAQEEDLLINVEEVGGIGPIGDHLESILNSNMVIPHIMEKHIGVSETAIKRKEKKEGCGASEMLSSSVSFP